MTEIQNDGRRLVSRRAVTRTAVWSVPAVAVVSAAPAFAASGPTDVGAYSVNGSCGTLGVIGPGFIITAGPEPLPVGSMIEIVGTGVANIGVFSSTSPIAIDVVNPSTRRGTLTAPLPANATLELRTTLSITVAFQLSATTALPTGYTATGAKTSAGVTSTLVLCSAT